jgi:hypothetical protein
MGKPAGGPTQPGPNLFATISPLRLILNVLKVNKIIIHKGKTARNGGRRGRSCRESNQDKSDNGVYLNHVYEKLNVKRG